MSLTHSLWLQVGGPGPHPCSSSWPRSIPIPIALSLSRLCRVIYIWYAWHLICLASQNVLYLYYEARAFLFANCRQSLLGLLLLLLLLLLTGGRSVSIVIELSFFYCHCIRSPIDSRCMTSDKVCCSSICATANCINLAHGQLRRDWGVVCGSRFRS